MELVELFRKGQDVMSVGCFAHVRRKFVEAAEAASRDRGSRNLANKAVHDIRQIFALEERITNLPAEERMQERLDKQKPLMEAFFHSLEGLIVSPKSALGRAINYALGQKEYILNVYRDGRLELTNNRAERSIKPFVIGRKNFLFANTPRGANASAILYSLVETAKETGVDPYRYFVFVLDEAAKLRAADKTDKIAELTPSYFKNLS